MTIMQFAFGRMSSQQWGGQVPAIHAGTLSSETVTPTSSNQQTTAVAPSGTAPSMCRVSTDIAVYVAFGTNPNALSGTGTRALLPAGCVDYFAVTPGDKAAVVLA